MKRYNRIMEMVWLVTAVLTLLLSAYIIYRKGWEDGWLLLSMPAIAAVMYAMRRFVRKKVEKSD